MSDSGRTRQRRLRSVLARALTAIAKLGLGAAPWTWAQSCGALLGRLLWRLSERDRIRTLDHLAIAFPDLSDTERTRLGQKSFVHLGVSAAEVLHLAHRGPDAATPHLEIHGWEHVEAARARSGVVLIATGHCGNWELMGPAFRSRHERPTALVRAFEEDWLERAARRYRSVLGSDTLARGAQGAAGRLLSLRRRGGCLIALVDQDIRAQSVYVPFFGRPAHTPIGPSELALRWSMAVVPGFCRRLEDGSHRIEFQPALPPHENAGELTAAITRTIEAQIRAHPDQWVWMHRRWRRQPARDLERRPDSPQRPI